MNMNKRTVFATKLPRASAAAMQLEIDKIMRAENLIINPTMEMTHLQAYIHNSERIYDEFYADQVEAECEDPLEVIMRKEEELLYTTGRNYAARILTSPRSI